MPVKNISLTASGNDIEFKFDDGASMRLYIKNATVAKNGNGVLDTYLFTNPTFFISISHPNNEFMININNVIIYNNFISDALIQKLEDIIKSVGGAAEGAEAEGASRKRKARKTRRSRK